MGYDGSMKAWEHARSERYMDITRDVLEPNALLLVEKAVWHRLRAVGVARVGSLLIVAMADPLDRHAIKELEIRTGLRIFPAAASEADILEALERSYDGR